MTQIRPALNDWFCFVSHRDTKPGRLARLLWRTVVLMLAMLAFSAGAYASDARIVSVDPVTRDGKLYIDADVQLDVTGELRTAASRGIPIYFTADVEIVSSRWWWFDKVIVKKQNTWRIVYNALTRQWRVGSGELSLPEASLDDALSRVRHIRGWAVADLSELTYDETYQGRVRLKLDTSLLARPFQIDALNSSAWSLSAPWKNFSFSISVDAHQP